VLSHVHASFLSVLQADPPLVDVLPSCCPGRTAALSGCTELNAVLDPSLSAADTAFLVAWLSQQEQVVADVAGGWLGCCWRLSHNNDGSSRGTTLVR